DLSQSHFFQMNVFFRQVRFTRQPAGFQKDAVEISDDPELNKPAKLFMERRIRFFLQPRFYDSPPWKPALKQTRRAFFTERFVKHRDFARGFVNFVWAKVFGQGLTQGPDFDDLGPNNPVVHEQLMERLAAEFVKHGHDPKVFLRWVCNSAPYHLRS